MPLVAPLFALCLGASAGGFPYEVHSATLDNGLQVHVVPMPTPGVVAVATWVAVGSRDEVDAGRTGFAHFFEHLLFYGSEQIGREAREQRVMELGAEENAWTWFDETVYHGTVSHQGWMDYARLDADRFQHLHLTAEDVRREAGAVYGELRKGATDPDTVVTQKLYGLAFGKHPYGHDTIGYEADVAAMPTALDYAEAFHRRFYRPEHTTWIVAGDVEPDAALALARELWSDWAPPKAPARPVITQEPTQETLRTTEVVWSSPTATRLALGWHAGGYDPDDRAWAGLRIASEALLARSGPLRRRLVLEEGLAYDVEGGLDALVDPGLFTITVRLKDPTGIDAARRIVIEELDRFAAGPDPVAIARARDATRYGALRRLEHPLGVVHALGDVVRRAGSPAALDRADATLAAVTADDAAAAVRATLRPQVRCEVVLRGPIGQAP